MGVEQLTHATGKARFSLDNLTPRRHPPMMADVRLPAHVVASRIIQVSCRTSARACGYSLGMGLGVGEVILIGILLVPVAVVYWVIRMAVRHGHQDAAREGMPE
jgi:hypothetical protein